MLTLHQQLGKHLSLIISLYSGKLSPRISKYKGQEAFIYTTARYKPNKSRNNSKGSTDHPSISSSSWYNSTLNNPQKSSSSRVSIGVSNSTRAKNHTFSSKQLKIPTKKSNLTSQVKVVSPGIKSTLSSLNMKMGAGSSGKFGVNAPSLQTTTNKRPPKAMTMKDYKKLTAQDVNSPGKKVTILYYYV